MKRNAQLLQEISTSIVRLACCLHCTPLWVYHQLKMNHHCSCHNAARTQNLLALHRLDAVSVCINHLNELIPEKHWSAQKWKLGEGSKDEIKQAESHLHQCIEEVWDRMEHTVWVPEERADTVYANYVQSCSAAQSSQVQSGYPASLCASEANTGGGPSSLREASKWSSKWLLRSKPHMLLGHNLTRTNPCLVNASTSNVYRTKSSNAARYYYWKKYSSASQDVWSW